MLGSTLLQKRCINDEEKRNRHIVILSVLLAFNLNKDINVTVYLSMDQWSLATEKKTELIEVLKEESGLLIITLV